MNRSLRRALTGAALTAACTAFVAACGLRTPVRPPEATAPVIPGEVSAERTGGAVVVRWNRAKDSADGERLGDLAAFAVERRRVGEEVWQRVAKIDVDDMEKVRRRKDFSWRDEQAGEPAPAYRVIAICADGQEGPAADATSVAAKQAAKLAETRASTPMR